MMKIEVFHVVMAFVILGFAFMLGLTMCKVAEGSVEEALVLRKLSERLDEQDERIRVLEEESVAHEAEMSLLKWILGAVGAVVVAVLPVLWEMRRNKKNVDK